MTPPNKQDIEQTFARIGPYVHKTPLICSTFFDREFEGSLYFKCENLQKTGSFKARGATNAVLQLTKKQRQNGVCTHSSGNHGQALAWAAKEANVACWVVVPENAPQVKMAAMKAYGANIVPCIPTLAARESELKKVMEQTGATFVPPYNYYPVIAGQATSAFEILQDEPGVDILITPVGGGGLLSGTALTAKYFGKEITVYGAEPAAADDAYRSLHAGQLIQQVHTTTIADGLRTSLGDKTFAIIRQGVSDILLADEVSIKKAMRDIWERMKIVVEPSAAVTIAAMRAHKVLFKGKKTAIILTGGNIDLGQLPFD